MKFIISIIISTAAVILTAYLLPKDMVYVENLTTAILIAVVLAFLNTVVKPVFIILTIPVTLVTLGLFLLVINAGIILLADYFIDGFWVKGFWAALIFSFILSLINSLFGNGNRVQKKQNNFN